MYTEDGNDCCERHPACLPDMIFRPPAGPSGGASLAATASRGNRVRLRCTMNVQVGGDTVQSIHSFLAGDSGTASSEYALIVSFISILTILSTAELGVRIGTGLDGIASEIETALDIQGGVRTVGHRAGYCVDPFDRAFACRPPVIANSGF